MSVQITEAQVILANLCERIERGTDGKYRLPGIVTVTELDVLKFFSSWSPGHAQSPAPLVNNPRAPTSQEAYVEPAAEGDLSATLGTPGAVTENVALDVSSLKLTAADQRYRVCMDFGTAMSKATFVYDNEDEGAEEIRLLMLGIPGDQEQVDETMLVSSVFIDDEGLLWFGQHAIERAQAAPDGRARMDNIKRALSEGNLGEPVDPAHNPSQYGLTYEDVILAYLAFFTWTINSALLSDVSEPKVARNFKRRFAMPCFPRASAQIVKDKLKGLLGEAQVLADTFKDDIHEGLELGRFLSALRQLRSEPRTYPFIEESVTEPLGVAGSILSWKASNNSLVLVVDIGAGTSDFSLYRLRVAINEDGTLNKAKTNAGEVEGTARGITEAGNHLDKILMAFILKQAGVDATHANYVNITHALERDIRNYKEALFSSGSVYVVLYTNDAIEVSLDEFMALDAITAFESSLRKTVTDILESADSTWIEWVRAHPNRRLTIVLAGGGASLPMVRRLAQGTVTAHGMTIPVAAAKSFPDWLRDDYPDLEASYPRIAASLGGARKNTIQSMGVLKATGGGVGEFILERF